MTRQLLKMGLFVCAVAAVSACALDDGDDEPLRVGAPSDNNADNNDGNNDDNNDGSNEDNNLYNDIDWGDNGVAALGSGEDSLDAIEVTTIAGEDEQLTGPRDVEIHPDDPEQIWVVNRNDNSAVVIDNAGTEEQTHEHFSAPGSVHFLAKPAALAFGDEHMATAQQTDEKTQPSTPEDFMGPTMWPSNAVDFDGGHPSHLDMLHNSPLSSGVAWEEGNAFWIFDGYHGSLTRYDFQEPHVPGGDDHSDGIVHRYADGEVGIVDEVVAHVAYDHDTDLLYAADTANNRIAVLDTTTGEVGSDIWPNYDNSEQKMVDGAELNTFIDGEEVGMVQPAGLELRSGLLFVGDNGTSIIYAFDLDGELVDSLDLSDVIMPGAMMGMAIADDGSIYVVDSEENKLVRLESKGS